MPAPRAVVTLAGYGKVPWRGRNSSNTVSTDFMCYKDFMSSLTRAGLTRRSVVGASVAGGALVRHHSDGPCRPRGLPRDRQALAAARFIDFGTNAEMRWDAVDPSGSLPTRRGCSSQPHGHADDRPDTWRSASSGRPTDPSPRGGRAVPVVRRPAPAARSPGRRRPRVHRQRPLLLRVPAGHAGSRHRVEARRRRGGHVGGRPARATC